MTKYRNTNRRHVLGAVLAALVLSACATTSYNAESMALLQNGRYEEGLSVLKKALDQSPEDVDLRQAYVRAKEQVVNRLVMIGDAERSAEHFDAAEAAYRRALAVAPESSLVETRLKVVKAAREQDEAVAKARSLYQNGDRAGASRLLRPVLLENPYYTAAITLQRKINEADAQQLTAEPELSANYKKPVTLQFRDANLKMVFESLAKTSGINILLDKDIRADLRTTIFVKNTSVEDTIDLILFQNQLEKKVLSSNTLFIYPALPAKTKEYQDLKVRSFHLVYADAKQMLTMIKTMLKTKDILVNEKTNSVIMRDTPEAVRLAQKIVADQDIPVPEVMLEVEVLEVKRSLLSDLGIKYPSQVTLTPSVPGGGDLTVGNFNTAIKRDNLLITPVPTITFNASLTNTNTKVLASPRIRVRDKEKAKIHIGDRLPVFSNSITPLATGAAVTTGSVQYVDTGIKLEVEPTIFPNGEVAIKLGLEVSVAQAPVVNAQSGTTAYPISTRTTSTVLQLKDGETNVLAGLIRDDEANTKVQIPGLGEIPVLGRLFGTDHTDGARTEIILSITPRLVGGTHLPDARTMEFWSGTEARPSNAPFQLRPTGTVEMSTDSGAAPRRGARMRALLAPRPGVRAPAPSPVASQPMSFLWLGPTQAKVGGKFSITLNTRSPENVRDLNMMVSYDPARLKVVDAVEGTFLRQGGPGSTFNLEIDQNSGRIAVTAASGAAGGVNGGGTVTTITFEAVAAGKAEVSLSSVSPSGPGGKAVNFAPPAAHGISVTP